MAGMLALGGVARGGATRAGYVLPRVCISVGGIQRAYGKPTATHKVDNLRIQESTNASPNTATFDVIGWEPQVGMEVIVTLGTVNTYRRRFGGTIMRVTEKPIGLLPAFAVEAVDFTWLLNRDKVCGHFTGSPSDIVVEWMETYAPAGFTTNKVETGLPTLEGGITVTNDDLSVAIQRLAKRIGGTAYVDYLKDLYFRVTSSEIYGTNPTTLTDGLDTLKRFSVSYDLSQVFTRVSMQGGGSTAATEVAVGETILPLLDAPSGWYGDVAGVVLSGPQKISYTARREGGAGGLVGPGAAPSSMLTLSGVFGGSLTAGGAYQYGYTFVTASGESLISPLAAITLAAVPGPTAPLTPTVFIDSGGASQQGIGGYHYAYTWTFPGSLETLPNPVAGAVITGGNDAVAVTGILSGPSGATGKKLYRTVVNGPSTELFLLATLTTEDSYIDYAADGALGAAAPTVATALCQQVNVSSIPAGQAGVVTERKLYRTTNGGSTPLLLATIPDNVTENYGPDTTADGSLGAAAPATDGSGLAQPSGQVAAGATSIPVAGGGFESEGWAIAGSQVIRYTGVTAAGLTGIPASGPGSLQAALGYNTTIAPAPQLSGIPASGDGSIRYTIPKGQDVNCFVTVEDLPAQAALADMLDDGSDGVRLHVLNDRRLTRDEATARAQAFLDRRKDPLPTAAYLSKDYNQTRGRLQPTALASLVAFSDTLAVQSVSISNFTPNLPPDFQVTASTELFSVEDLLQKDVA